MALTEIDFVKGVDLTVLDPINASDVNNLVDLATTKMDTNGDGKGLNILTIDQALDTPTVPDAAAVVKWQKYQWTRIPHASASDATPKIYAWNPAITTDPTYQNWVQTVVDITTIQAQIDAALAAAQAANSNSNVALTTANAANVAATSALSVVTDAQTDATAALANAAAALAAAVAAQNTANTANTTANTALTTANAKRDITAALNPGTAGQKLRTNVGATAVEWFDDYKQYVKVSQSLAKNTAPQVLTSADWTKITINQEDHDAGGLVTLAADIITFAVPGIYRVNIAIPVATVKLHKSALVDTDANTVLLLGTNAGANTGDHVSSESLITGLITITDTVKNLAVYTYCTDVGYLGGGQFGEINIDYPKVAGVATKEVYFIAEFWKIN